MPPLSAEEANRLRDAMRGSGISAGDLARVLGVNDSTMRHWLSGHRDMPEHLAPVLWGILAFRTQKPTT